VGLGDYPNTIQGSLPNTRLGFWGWDKGTWGLGVGLGDYPNTIQGSLPNTRLGFWGWDKGTWGLGVGLGDYPNTIQGSLAPWNTWRQPSKLLEEGPWKIPSRFC